MLLDDAALESKDQSVDNQRDFDIRWTANSLYAGKFAPMRSLRAVFSVLTHGRSISASFDTVSFTACHTLRAQNPQG